MSISARDPKSLMDTLENRYNFKLNVMVPIKFHLGFYFFRDRNVVLFFSLCKYIYNMFQTYMTMFGSNSKLKKAIVAPLEQ